MMEGVGEGGKERLNILLEVRLGTLTLIGLGLRGKGVEWWG